jgi:hypothetical protein
MCGDEVCYMEKLEAAASIRWRECPLMVCVEHASHNTPQYRRSLQALLQGVSSPSTLISIHAALMEREML